MTFVGRCAHCQGPVALAPGRLMACCPCGRTRVPAEFFLTATNRQPIQPSTTRRSSS